MDGEGQTLATTKATPTVFQPLTPNLTQPLALSPSPSPKHLTPTPTRTKALLTIDPKLPTAYLLLTTHYLLPTTKAMLTVYKNGQEHTGYDNVPVRHVVTLATVRLLQRTVRSVVVNASPSPKPNVLTGRLALCGGRARRRRLRDRPPCQVRHFVRRLFRSDAVHKVPRVPRAPPAPDESLTAPALDHLGWECFCSWSFQK